MIEVKVKFLASLENLVSATTGSLKVRNNITLKDFLTLANEIYFKNKLLDKLGRKIYPVVILVDGEQRDLNEKLKDGSTITFAPIVSGG